MPPPRSQGALGWEATAEAHIHRGRKGLTGDGPPCGEGPGSCMQPCPRNGDRLSPSAFMSYSCWDKLPQLGGLRQQKFVLELLEPEIKNQLSVGRPVLWGPAGRCLGSSTKQSPGAASTRLCPASPWPSPLLPALSLLLSLIRTPVTGFRTQGLSSQDPHLHLQ